MAESTEQALSIIREALNDSLQVAHISDEGKTDNPNEVYVEMVDGSDLVVTVEEM